MCLREITFHTHRAGCIRRDRRVFHRYARAAALTTLPTDPLHAAALAGLGITGLPSFVAEDALSEHALERVLPRWHLFLTTIYAGLPSRKHVPTRTRAFVGNWAPSPRARRVRADAPAVHCDRGSPVRRTR